MSNDLKWVKSWCKLNLDELEDYRGFIVAVHPVHGIINAARNVATLHEQLEFTKRKVRADVAIVHTADHLPPLEDKRMEDEDDEPVPEDPNPPPPLTDPFDNSHVVLDGSQPVPVEVEQTKPEGTPFPSKDPQPPFQPRRDIGSLRIDGVMHPGARSSWSGRGPRYD